MLDQGEILLPNPEKDVRFERIPLASNGRFTSAFTTEHPEVLKARDVWPDILEANRGQAEISLILPGYKQRHVEEIMAGRMVKALIDKTNDTVAFIDWMNTTHIEELIVCGLADHFEKEHIKGIKLFGASHGGYFALRLASGLHKLSIAEGLELPIESTVVAVAPTSRDCFNTRFLLDSDLLIGASHLVLDTISGRITGKPLFVPEFVKHPRSDIIRLRAVAKKPFIDGDFPKGMKVHYFATDPDQGNVDKIVNQPLAIANLRQAGLEVIVHKYQAGPGGHVIAYQDRERMNADLVEIFGASDKSL